MTITALPVRTARILSGITIGDGQALALPSWRAQIEADPVVPSHLTLTEQTAVRWSAARRFDVYQAPVETHADRIAQALKRQDCLPWEMEPRRVDATASERWSHRMRSLAATRECYPGIA